MCTAAPFGDGNRSNAAYSARWARGASLGATAEATEDGSAGEVEEEIAGAYCAPFRRPVLTRPGPST